MPAPKEARLTDEEMTVHWDSNLPDELAVVHLLHAAADKAYAKGLEDGRVQVAGLVETSGGGGLASCGAFYADLGWCGRKAGHDGEHALREPDASVVHAIQAALDRLLEPGAAAVWRREAQDA